MNKALSLLSSKPLQIALIVGGLILFIYFKGVAAAKDKELYENPIPGGPNSIPTIGNDPSGKPIPWSAVPLANELHEVLDGVSTWAYEKERTFQKMMVLSPGMLTEMYNTFNKLFYSENEGTMTDWISDEFNISTTSCRPELLQKLRSMNLR